MYFKREFRPQASRAEQQYKEKQKRVEQDNTREGV